MIREFPIDQTATGKMLLVSAAPYYRYADGVRSDDVEGYKYDVVLPSSAFEKLTVKVAGSQTVEITGPDPIPVTFEHLIVRPYVLNGSLGITASANKITRAKAS